MHEHCRQQFAKLWARRLDARVEKTLGEGGRWMAKGLEGQAKAFGSDPPGDEGSRLPLQRCTWQGLGHDG